VSTPSLWASQGLAQRVRWRVFAGFLWLAQWFGCSHPVMSPMTVTRRRYDDVGIPGVDSFVVFGLEGRASSTAWPFP
jgi:hypothetical protein